LKEARDERLGEKLTTQGAAKVDIIFTGGENASGGNAIFADADVLAMIAPRGV
jgi:hypothetical protein